MKYPVVYSYKRSKSRELELSIESLKNIQEWNGKIFIIGDDPQLDLDYTHVPIKYDWGRKSGSKSNDEYCAYLTAADFLKKFIIMADDIYILKEWNIEHQNRGTLEEHAESRKQRGMYTRQLLRTKKVLEKHGKPVLSYEMHIPFLVTADHIKGIEEFMRRVDPIFTRSIIGNWYGIKSKLSVDPKNQPITYETVLYSSQDSTFDYEKIKKFLI